MPIQEKDYEVANSNLVGFFADVFSSAGLARVPASLAGDGQRPRSAANIRSPRTTRSSGSRTDSRVSSDR
jgi:hypothetical protein